MLELALFVILGLSVENITVWYWIVFGIWVFLQCLDVAISDKKDKKEEK